MWSQKSIKSIETELDTNISFGLSSEKANQRLKKYGSNILPTKPPPSLFIKFFQQFRSILIIILILATIASAFLGDLIDAMAIFTIVLLNATIGTYQETKAEKTLASITQKDIPFTLILRNKQIEKIPSVEVVPGDILLLEEGQIVPADGRIFESIALTVDESILTGESASRHKSDGILTEDNLPLAEKDNMIFKDTKVVSGRGKAVVVATGSTTEIGKIAQFLEKEKEEISPLALELDKVGTMLSAAVLTIAFLIFLVSGLRHLPLLERLLIAISLSVAAIPEGLPAIATITLALGVERLAKKKTIVKKLLAVETLGAVKIIATDKTGTLTENKMNVTQIVTADGIRFRVEGEGYSPKGTFLDKNGKMIDPRQIPNLINLLTAAALANNATLKDKHGNFEILGDTTEGALLIGAVRAGISLANLQKAYRRIFEIPFSQSRKMMSVVVKIEEAGDIMLFAKGAPEEIVKLCRMNSQQISKSLGHARNLAAQGLRTLAVASTRLTKNQIRDLLEKDLVKEENLSFLGIIGEKDNLRLDIKDAIEKAKLAGIKTIMITGDHLTTATTIGLDCGIAENKNQAVTEKDIDPLSLSEIAQLIKKDRYRIFARVSPLGKLKLVEAMKLIPNTQVAVTGDGVNDAPALKAAHVGIAMGSGTDIAREVADLVITDDNYATIISAIKEGRIIFANLIKFIRYLISCNLAEVLVVTLAVVFDKGIPLLPIQLLWINLITDGLPALALGIDPPEKDIMSHPPRSSNQLLHSRRWSFMLLEGSLIAVAVFVLYVYAADSFNQIIAQTIAFTSLSTTQLIHALNNRSTRLSLLALGIFSNMKLIWAILISLILQYAAVSTSLGHLIFKTMSLSLSQWLAIAVVSVIPFIFVEAKKAGLKAFKI